MRVLSRTLCLVAAILAAACGNDAEPELDPRYESPGAFGVGNATLTMTDDSRDRTLTVEVWYPQQGSGQGTPVEEFVVSTADQATYQGLLEEAPVGCPSTQAGSTRDAISAGDEPLPLLVFSHCHNCVRFSSFAIAERLASHGFVVAAPDHAGNTLFDDLAGTGVELNTEFLHVFCDRRNASRNGRDYCRS